MVLYAAKTPWDDAGVARATMNSKTPPAQAEKHGMELEAHLVASTWRFELASACETVFAGFRLQAPPGHHAESARAKPTSLDGQL